MDRNEIAVILDDVEARMKSNPNSNAILGCSTIKELCRLALIGLGSEASVAPTSPDGLSLAQAASDAILDYATTNGAKYTILAGEDARGYNGPNPVSLVAAMLRSLEAQS